MTSYFIKPVILQKNGKFLYQTCADTENYVGGGGGGGSENFSHQRISQRALRTSLEEQLDQDPIASRGGPRTIQD